MRWHIWIVKVRRSDNDIRCIPISVKESEITPESTIDVYRLIINKADNFMRSHMQGFGSYAIDDISSLSIHERD